jgi:phosphoribosylamine--glycine ligase
VVGPDAALADGVVDLFQSRGLAIFGPTKAAAELEWSKDFAKGFMARHGIPTSGYSTFTTGTAQGVDQAHAHIDAEWARTGGAPIVIKADGLAAGKGVVVAMNPAQAHAAVDDMMLGGKFAQAGARVVIEEFLQGEEASFFVMCDGTHAIPLATAQDHKRLLDGDLGPNTGGMGAYSPAPVVTPDVHAKVIQQIVKPTIAGMAAEGRPFCGFLFVGLMINAEGHPFVVEYNARMGDPETEVVMPRLKSDLLGVLEAAIASKLDEVELDWDRRTALCVILASHGYPDSPRKGDVISGITTASTPESTQDPLTDSVVFHAGTANRDGALVSNGGRVLCAVGMGDTVRFAQMRAYETAAKIAFDGQQMRSDIGHRALRRH